MTKLEEYLNPLLLKKNNFRKISFASLKKVISKLQTRQISKPIRTSSGFIIIMIEDKRVSELKFNLAEKIDEAIRFRRNDQLNQFSNIYFNKLKKDLIIYGL